MRRIANIELTPFTIAFRRPFRFGSVEVKERAGALVRLRNDSGTIGVGELTVHPAAPTTGLREAMNQVQAVARRRPDATELEAVSTGLLPPARAGLQAACLDLRARATGVRLAELLGGTRHRRVPVNATLGIGPAEESAEAARHLVAMGFRCLKLKASPRDIDDDERRLDAVRAATGSGVALRLDANAAWTVPHAVAAITRLQRYELEYVEQPVTGVKDMAALRRQIETPLAADESVNDLDSIEQIALAGAADVVVLKPSLCGLRAAVAMARRATELGLGVVVTSAIETSVGITAALHLAAALPGALPACGLATADLLARDLVRNRPAIADGHMDLPPAPGLGVEIDERALGAGAAGTEAAP